MNIIIPMAGRGQRFKDEGVKTPKPFIKINGKPMIQVAIENLGLKENYILVMQREHVKKYGQSMLYWLPEKTNVVALNEYTQGPACTCLAAKNLINTNEPLLYANCDQYLEWDSKRFIDDVKDFDGGLLMYRDRSLCGSFALMDESCYVKKTVEKEVLSDVSSTGIYYWSKGSDFVRNAESMIKKKHTAKNGEFYAINVYNEGIKEGKKYVVSFIKRFWRLGVPVELDQFLNHINPQSPQG
jgi:NDP-sugar pyrophosphorylase family protein